MLYWSIVFLILAWGSAILAFGPLPGSLTWIARIAAMGFASGIYFRGFIDATNQTDAHLEK